MTEIVAINSFNQVDHWIEQPDYNRPETALSLTENVYQLGGHIKRLWGVRQIPIYDTNGTTVLEYNTKWIDRWKVERTSHAGSEVLIAWVSAEAIAWIGENWTVTQKVLPCKSGGINRAGQSIGYGHWWFWSGGDRPYYSDGITNFQQLSTSSPINYPSEWGCNCLGTLQNLLVCSGVRDLTKSYETIPNLIFWSDIYDDENPNELPDFDFDDPASFAGFTDLGSAGERIVAIHQFKNSLFVYKERSVWSMSPTGNISQPWVFQQLFDEFGTYNTKCVLNLKGRQIVMTEDGDVIAHDGNSYESMMPRRLRHSFERVLQTNRAPNWIHDSSTKTVAWILDHTTGDMFFWDYEHNRWYWGNWPNYAWIGSSSPKYESANNAWAKVTENKTLIGFQGDYNPDEDRPFEEPGGIAEIWGHHVDLPNQIPAEVIGRVVRYDIPIAGSPDMRKLVTKVRLMFSEESQQFLGTLTLRLKMSEHPLSPGPQPVTQDVAGQSSLNSQFYKSLSSLEDVQEFTFTVPQNRDDPNWLCPLLSGRFLSWELEDTPDSQTNQEHSWQLIQMQIWWEPLGEF